MSRVEQRKHDVAAATARAPVAVLPAVVTDLPPGADEIAGGLVLLVEDDESTRRALALAVSEDGWQVMDASSGREALRQMTPDPTAPEGASGAPDVVLLDLTLPDMDGLEVLSALRAVTDVPVIIVTGRRDSRDVTTGLRLGADDYVTKPVVASELTARIHALLRRARGSADGVAREVRLGPLVLRAAERTVSKDGRELALTRTEFRLLHELAMAQDRVVTREQLLLRVWGYDFFGDTRLLDVHIRRLRLKVEDDPDRPDLIRTVRGVGYRAHDVGRS